MSADTLTRTFVCLEIPSAVRDRIERLQRQLANSGATVGWVKKGNLHVTLKFLGEISAGQIADVCRVVAETASGAETFDPELKELGSFPNQHKPRILWIGFAGVPILLEELFESIEEKLFKLGFPRETRRHTPHLTIGRIKAPSNPAHLTRVLKSVEFHSDPFHVGEVTLMRSELKSSGAVYSPIQLFPLKKA